MIKPKTYNIRAAAVGLNEKNRIERARKRKLSRIDSSKEAEKIMRLIGETA